MQFYIKNKLVRRATTPPLDKTIIRNRVKSRVHLDHFEMFRVPRKPIGRWQIGRIPAFNKTGIRPARRPDKNLSGFGRRHERGNARRSPNATAVAKLVAGAGFEPAAFRL